MYRYILPQALIAVLVLQLIGVSCSDHNGNTVLVKSWEDVQRDLSVAILTDTELNVQTEKDIKLRHVGLSSCTLKKVLNSSSTDVMINDKPEPMAKLLTDERMVALKLLMLMH